MYKDVQNDKYEGSGASSHDQSLTHLLECRNRSQLALSFITDGSGEADPPRHCKWGRKQRYSGKHFAEDFFCCLFVLNKTKLSFLYDTTVILLGIYPREIKAYVHS